VLIKRIFGLIKAHHPEGNLYTYPSNYPDFQEHPDIQMLYLKLCEDYKMIPIIQLIFQLTGESENVNNSNTLDLSNFRLNTAWTDIVTQVL
jgi:hypothetical protein